MQRELSFKEKVDITVALGKQIDPVIKEYADKVIDKYGVDVSIIVASNLAINMLNYAMLLIKDNNGNPEEFLTQVLFQFNATYQHSSSELEKDNLLERLTKRSSK